MPAYGDQAVGTMQEYGESAEGSKARQDADYFRGAAEGAQGRKGVAVFGSGIDTARANEAQARGQQQNALGLVANAAAGNAPSQAQIVGRQQTQAAIASQRAMAASARGPQAMALAQQSAAQNTAAAQSAIGGQTMANSAAEQQANRAAYMQAAGQMRSGDLSAQSQLASEYTTQAQMEDAQRARNDSYAQGMYGNEIAINTQQQNAHNAGVQAEQQYNVGMKNAETASKGEDWKMIQGAMSGAGGMLGGMMSDETTKEGVTKASDGDVKSLLRALSPASYKYKNEHADKPGAARGDQWGPASAQSIASTKLGKSMVKTGDDGLLRIDGPAAVKALLGGVSYLHDKVEKLEKK